MDIQDFCSEFLALLLGFAYWFAAWVYAHEVGRRALLTASQWLLGLIYAGLGILHLRPYWPWIASIFQSAVQLCGAALQTLSGSG